MSGQIYTGAKLTVHGILGEAIDLSFNNVDGAIHLRFYDKDGPETQAVVSYAAAKQLIAALNTAFFMRKKED